MKICTCIALVFFYIFPSYAYADECGSTLQSENLNDRLMRCPPDFEVNIDINYEIAYENIRKSLTSCMDISSGIVFQSVSTVIGEVYSTSNTAEVLVFSAYQFVLMTNYFRIIKDGKGTNIKSWRLSSRYPYIVIPQLTEELARGGWDIDCKIIDDAEKEHKKETSNKNTPSL